MSKLGISCSYKLYGLWLMYVGILTMYVGFDIGFINECMHPYYEYKLFQLYYYYTQYKF